jgi:hypothetical protein
MQINAQQWSCDIVHLKLGHGLKNLLQTSVRGQIGVSQGGADGDVLAELKDQRGSTRDDVNADPSGVAQDFMGPLIAALCKMSKMQ